MATILKVEKVENDTQKSEASEEKQPFSEPKKGKGVENYWFVFVLIGLGAIMVVLFLYFSNQKIRNTVTQYSPQPSFQTIEPTIIEEKTTTEEELKPERTSDEIVDIEKDLDDTDLTDIDVELEEINQEFNLP